ncbi:MAG TPA: twin-arginine translocase TatA/TatE family subunit [Actinomycetota bacterium]|jgi:sec-independent protein translocase protein TatA|nr:twin-arginine translocase TatA/TatE family subunit [Actinomycetota bacterium]
MSFGPEWFVVLGIIVLLFGAKKLPELARSMGKASNEFKQGLKEGTSPEPADEPSPPSQPPKPAETGSDGPIVP